MAQLITTPGPRSAEELGWIAPFPLDAAQTLHLLEWRLAVEITAGRRGGGDPSPIDPIESLPCIRMLL